MSPSPVKLAGEDILAMPVNRPGSDDRVAHTLKHFLRPDEAWELAPPRSAHSPRDARGEADAKRWKITIKFHDTAWWDQQRLAWISRVHDEGYYPRYAEAAAAMGAWGTRGSAWICNGSRRYAGERNGFCVAGDLVAEGFRVVSAYRLSVLREGEKGPGLGTFADLCQSLKLKGLSVGTDPEGGVPNGDGTKS